MRLGLIWSVALALMLSACGGGDSTSPQATGPRPPAGYEIYTENGGVARPANAIDVFIVYSPESQAYMPDVIRDFNSAYQQGRNPVTGQPLTSEERPIYVWGTDPVTGSSGTVMQGIVNAIIAPTDPNIYRPTIYQPSVGHWLALANYYSGRTLFDLPQARATALSPVVIATWESRLQAMRTTLGKTEIGWSDLLAVLNSPNGWCDYGLEPCRRAVFYGHADPNHSSTGLSATIAQFYACAADANITERRLTSSTVRNSRVQACVAGIQDLVKHYSRRTEDFLEDLGRGPDFLDFLAVEEGDLICINTGGSQGGIPCTRPPGDDRLVAIYPEDGTYIHEHPFGIVLADWVTEEQRAAAVIFTDYVLTESAQRGIMREGFRPANPNVTLDYPFVAANGVREVLPANELDVPEGDAVVAVQETWQAVKKRADVMILVDVSGSMNNENRIGMARQALTALVQGMNPTNRVGLMSFSNIVTIWSPPAPVETITNQMLYHINGGIPSGTNYRPDPIRTPFYNQFLRADGSTSLYTAIRSAMDVVSALNRDESRIRVVLVLSDGQDTCDGEGCSSLDDVIHKIERSQNSRNPVIVIPIAYGTDADARVLNLIARAARTRVISGDPSNIREILTLLNGYF